MKSLSIMLLLLIILYACINNDDKIKRQAHDAKMEHGEKSKLRGDLLKEDSTNLMVTPEGTIICDAAIHDFEEVTLAAEATLENLIKSAAVSKKNLKKLSNEAARINKQIRKMDTTNVSTACMGVYHRSKNKYNDLVKQINAKIVDARIKESGLDQLDALDF